MHLCHLNDCQLTVCAVARYDNCNCEAEDPIVERFTDMSKALNATGRPVLYSMCIWGTGDAWRWASQVRTCSKCYIHEQGAQCDWAHGAGLDVHLGTGDA